MNLLLELKNIPNFGQVVIHGIPLTEVADAIEETNDVPSLSHQDILTIFGFDEDQYTEEQHRDFISGFMGPTKLLAKRVFMLPSLASQIISRKEDSLVRSRRIISVLLSHLPHRNIPIELVESDEFSVAKCFFWESCDISVRIHKIEIERLTDDELAFILAHELAHYIHGHLLSGSRGQELVLSNISHQSEADLFAVALVAVAGYDVHAVIPVFEKNIKDNPPTFFSRLFGDDRVKRLAEVKRYLQDKYSN